MKYLIVGLGNIGSEYENTRHNIGFSILDEWVKQEQAKFITLKHASYTELNYKGRIICCIKPTTYMNLSGKAVNFWMQELAIPLERVLVLVDDLALPFGTLRLKPQGGSAGHNGLKDIEAVLSTNIYARLRFGIGDNFSKGRQVDYVLGKFSKEEQENLFEPIDKSIEIIKSFCTQGIALTMTQFN